MKVDRDKHWKRRPFSGVPEARKSKGPINMAMTAMMSLQGGAVLESRSRTQPPTPVKLRPVDEDDEEGLLAPQSSTSFVNYPPSESIKGGSAGLARNCLDVVARGRRSRTPPTSQVKRGPFDAEGDGASVLRSAKETRPGPQGSRRASTRARHRFVRTRTTSPRPPSERATRGGQSSRR
jgi:hypothetical protein